MDRRLRLVQMLHERDDPAFVEELVRLLVALVLNGDADPAIEERELAQALRENVEAEGRRLEDHRIGLEGNLRATFLGHSGRLYQRLRHAPVIALEVDLP